MYIMPWGGIQGPGICNVFLHSDRISSDVHRSFEDQITCNMPTTLITSDTANFQAHTLSIVDDASSCSQDKTSKNEALSLAEYRSHLNAKTEKSRIFFMKSEHAKSSKQEETS